MYLSVKQGDEAAFERNYSQLLPYYTDARALLPPSPQARAGDRGVGGAQGAAPLSPGCAGPLRAGAARCVTPPLHPPSTHRLQEPAITALNLLRLLVQSRWVVGRGGRAG